MSVANLYLRALSSPGPDQPKLSAVIADWDLGGGLLTAELSEAHTEPAKRAPHPGQSSQRTLRAAG